MARRNSASEYITTQSENLDFAGQSPGQVHKQKQISRSLESLLSTDTGYDTVTPSRSESVHSCFHSQKYDLVNQVQNLLVDDKSKGAGKLHSKKNHRSNSDEIGEFIKN